MSKLSEPLKALINAAHARPNTVPAPTHIATVYSNIANASREKNVGLPAWLCASTAATMTMNSPDSLLELYRLASMPEHQTGDSRNHPLLVAELMREAGLKCIGLNGIPRTINMLGAFYNGLPNAVQKDLQKRQPRRKLSSSTIKPTTTRGNALWDSIYHPVTDKLTRKLAQSHPDLPIFIIEGAYGALFSDPPHSNDNRNTTTSSSTTSASTEPSPPNIGRVLTSVLAIACLRAQTGVGPQIVSHVFGLRKAFEDGTAAREDEILGGKWLASDEGSIWLLQQIDSVVQAIGGDRGTTFAQGFGGDVGGAVKAKL
ncbi:uncharacterized protein K489DRAFT_236954 [Dissoconium aciculare CBS 342.82]|uniref:Mitochondrial protein n=1 Tax=Dissoconium aciculare CBS 342.82 TaxID=1314786 RepID=A0A6J3M2K9_9PEZI|nr:uncharacterized protein K489DRAFT_236954 [Dissoconium aciculare CBS 342.82]KAF1822250.1 hypothetical protein K489DRAFT_236954 [Dissoconium aciculare CBS 342.82]